MHIKKPAKTNSAAHIAAAFRYSISGLRTASGETAIRHELVIAAVHTAAMFLVEMPLVCRILLTSMLGWLLTVELLNTAIEAVVDLASPEWSRLAKKAKDLGSAAVFCSLATFLLGWGAVLAGGVR